MNVYLAGKMDREYGAWRDAILGFRHLAHPPYRCQNWEIRVDEEWGNGGYYSGEMLPWPLIDNAVLGLHTYVGPYRQVLDPMPDKWSSIGEFHGSISEGHHGMMDESSQRRIIQYAREAIADADLVFAFINMPDAYGTIAEIGFAAALGKFVAVLCGPAAHFEMDDFWFVQGMATRVLPGWHYDIEDEGERAKAALKDAFVAYSAWKEQAVRHPVPVTSGGDALLRAAAQSFGQIERWTSDPRVRSEAETMLRALGRRG